MIELAAITTVDGLVGLRREWDALAGAAPDAGPFLSWPWVCACARRLRGELQVLVLRGDGGELRAIIPLVRRGGCLEFIGADRSIYLGVLARAEDLAAAAQAFAGWLRPSRDWRRVSLASLPAEQLHPLQAAVAQAGIAHRVMPGKPSYVMPLPDSPNAFAESLPRSFRKRLDYYRRRLERECRVEYRLCRPREDPAAMDQFLRLHLLRTRDRGRKSRLAESDFAEFAREALSGMDGAASVGLLECDGRAAAALAGVDCGDTFYFWNGGFDPALAHYNVGDIIQRLTIETAIRAGLRRFDFLWGGEDYKLRWGAARRETYRLEAERSRLRLAARAAGRAGLRDLRSAAGIAVRRLRAGAPVAPRARCRRREREGR